MTTAKIIADSINSSGNRITTWILTYPRFIHAEMLTHRVFSRNAASSRAIPIEKMLKAVKETPAMPEFWGANQKGMQAIEQLNDKDLESVKDIWLQARDEAIDYVQMLNEGGLHKQIANRVIEPWGHITVLATATEYTNFFKLRAHKDAQPEFQVLAYTMLREYLNSTPKQLKSDEWHIPFNDKMPENLTQEQKLKIATARAARVSYITFDKDIDPDKDYELHDRLANSGHWSPFEHCAQAMEDNKFYGNFKGWKQYRKLFPNENPQDVKLVEIFGDMPEWVQEAIMRNDLTTN